MRRTSLEERMRFANRKKNLLKESLPGIYCGLITVTMFLATHFALNSIFEGPKYEVKQRTEVQEPHKYVVPRPISQNTHHYIPQ